MLTIVIDLELDVYVHGLAILGSGYNFDNEL